MSLGVATSEKVLNIGSYFEVLHGYQMVIFLLAAHFP